MSRSRTVVFSDEAAEDLAGIQQWYQQPGAGARAKRVLTRLADGIDHLAQFPLMGHAGALPDTWEFTVGLHRVVYRVTDDLLVVVAIFGPGQAP